MIVHKKIVNDPVHGFIDIPDGLILKVVEHPCLQRLRNIKQLGMTYLVYPGACHSRFSHALGAMHLMREAIGVLRSKGVEISSDEETAACVAILLHDIGHGPFSHALESAIVTGMTHEEISLALMKRINDEMNGEISEAISIFTGEHRKKFLHQLVSSQLDVDRLDYLTRDSFYSGVAEGMIGLERIIKMLTVRDNSLIVESKGVNSVEKFLISRRLMYWQVYLHKTVIAAERLMINLLRRASFLLEAGESLEISRSLRYLLLNGASKFDTDNILDNFLLIDDSDIIYSIKRWEFADDAVLSDLSKSIMHRNLPKVEMSSSPVNMDYYDMICRKMLESGKYGEENLNYYVFRGVVENKGYDSDEEIRILNKDGSTDNIYDISDMLSAEAFSRITKKYFLCRPKNI